MDFLSLRVVGSITVLQVIIGVVGLFVVSALWRKLKAIFRSQTPGTHQHRSRCPECGWVGVVSAYRPVCRKCANTRLMRLE